MRIKRTLNPGSDGRDAGYTIEPDDDGKNKRIALHVFDLCEASALVFLTLAQVDALVEDLLKASIGLRKQAIIDAIQRNGGAQ